MSPLRLPADATVEATVALLAALAHPARLLVLVALLRGGPRSAGGLQDLCELEQSAMSHQLKILREAHLVVAEREGRQMIYRLADRHVAHIVEDALAHVDEHA